MELILWRHADAEGLSAHIVDMKRRLTPRGEKQARQIASWLRKHHPDHLRILVSPAERAQQTAQALNLPFEIEPAIGLGAEASDLLAASGWPNEKGTVLLVGHQPTLGRLAALLLSGREDNWAIKKGGLWWFSRHARPGETETVLRAVINPDLAE